MLDEYLPIVNAERLQAGEVPHRDFFTLYPPLVPALDALTLRLAPGSILAVRVLCLAFVVAGLLLVSEIATMLSGDGRAGAALGVLAAVMYGAPPWGYPLVHATVLVLAALLVALRSSGPRWIFLVGALLGLAATARHDLAAVGSLPVVGLVAARTRSPRSVGLALLGAAVPVLLLAGLLALGGAGSAALDQLIGIPATIYSRARALPWPRADLESLARVYSPLALGVLGLAVSVLDPHADRERRSAEVATTSLVMLLAVPGLVRPDAAHLSAVRMACPTALAIILRASPSRSLHRAFVAIAIAAAAPQIASGVLGAVEQVRALVGAREVFEARGPRRGLLLDPEISNEARRNTLDLAARIANGRRIYVGLREHDRILVNDVAFYVEAEALPATRYHELVPLIANTERVQREIVADLERTRPPVVVLVDAKHSDEPNESSKASGVHVLDDYIRTAYEPVRGEGPYLVLGRRR
jgi:hypothetical protein